MSSLCCLLVQFLILLPMLQIQALDAAMTESQQALQRVAHDHQHALAALQGQLNKAVGEMEVLRAGAGHAKDEALASLKVCYIVALYCRAAVRECLVHMQKM